VDAPGATPLTPDLALAGKLRGAGLKATRPRLVVYRALLELEGHHSVDEIGQHLRGIGSGLPREAIFDVVEALRLAGLVLGADAGPGRALYEAGSDPHHHFVCRSCADVIDVPCAAGTTPCLDGAGDVGRVDEAQVIYRGLCAGCADAPRQRQ
jgi:Fe2+ or Zn2+ uptake regulation protein